MIVSRFVLPRVVLPLMLCWPLLAAADESLVFKTSFMPDADGKRIVDESGNANHGTLSGNARLAGTPGDHYLSLDGSDGALGIIPPGDKLNLRKELTISFWFRCKKLPAKQNKKPNTGEYSLFSRGWDWRLDLVPLCEPPSYGYGGLLKLAISDDQKKVYSAGTAPPIESGRWYHVAYNYSVSRHRYEIYVDGSLASSISNNNLGQLANLDKNQIQLGSLPGNYYVLNGDLAEVKIHSKALAAADIIAGEQEFLRRRLAGIEREAQTVKSPEAEAICRDIAAVLAKKTVPIRDYGRFQNELAKLNDYRQLVASGRNGNGMFVGYIVKPHGNRAILPDTRLLNEEAGSELMLVAAPGEFEPGSFVIRPLCDMSDFKPVAGDLKSMAGDVIPSSAVDLKIIKVWYQSAGYVNDEHGLRVIKKLTPELLVNDDSLVRVDYERQEQYLKLRYQWGWGPGDKYVWISEPGESKYFRYPIPADQYPVKDSAELLPLSMRRQVNQQFWVTVRPPENARAGVYRGKIALHSGKTTVGTIDLTLQVLPFKLPPPKTCYDLNQEFISSFYYFTFPVGKGPGSISSNGRNLTQYVQELHNLRDHNVMNPMLDFPGYMKSRQNIVPADRDHLVNVLKLWRAAGLSTRPVFMGLSTDRNLGFEVKLDGAEGDLLKDLVKKNIDLVEEAYGHRDVYFYGVDEAVGQVLKSEMPLWRVIQDAGGKVYVSGMPAAIDSAMDTLDLLICATKPSPEYAARMHAREHKIWIYAFPQGIPANPLTLRKNLGLVTYKANYDGVCHYAWYNSAADPWNDFDNIENGSDWNMVYPTADGVIDTITWEEYREGIDDIRYATAFKEQIAAAAQSGDDARKALAAQAEKWFEDIDVAGYECDPYELRLQIIKWILELRKDK